MKHLLFSISILLILLGCTKENGDYHYLSDRQSSMASFKKGSYWLMRDSITGRLDSFVITDLERRFDSYTGGTGTNNYEKYIFSLEQYENGNMKHAGELTFESTDEYQEFWLSGSVVGLRYSAYNTSNVNIHNNTYNNVAIVDNSKRYGPPWVDTTSNFKAYINPEKILLKVSYQKNTENNVWELEKAVLLR